MTLYIESGADPNARSKFVANRETPLHDAVLGGHLQMVGVILEWNVYRNHIRAQIEASLSAFVEYENVSAHANCLIRTCVHVH